MRRGTESTASKCSSTACTFRFLSRKALSRLSSRNRKQVLSGFALSRSCSRDFEPVLIARSALPPCYPLAASQTLPGWATSFARDRASTRSPAADRCFECAAGSSSLSPAAFRNSSRRKRRVWARRRQIVKRVRRMRQDEQLGVGGVAQRMAAVAQHRQAPVQRTVRAEIGIVAGEDIENGAIRRKAVVGPVDEIIVLAGPGVNQPAQELVAAPAGDGHRALAAAGQEHPAGVHPGRRGKAAIAARISSSRSLCTASYTSRGAGLW